MNLPLNAPVPVAASLDLANREDGMYKALIVAPSFNNSGTVQDVLDRSLRLDLPVIAVDDGSTDETPQILLALSNARSQLEVLTHKRNLGKAAALRTGFRTGIDRGFTHAVTIDTDGQLDPEEIPILLRLSRDNPLALIVGARDERSADYPWRSRFGRRFSNLMVRLESGARVEDTQCGLRVYPLRSIQATRCRTSRFAFETEIITRAAWAGFPVVSVPVTCRYFEMHRRVSHYRPLVDSLHAILLHMMLLLQALLFWRSSCAPRVVGLEEVDDLRPLAKLLRWVSPRGLWHQVRSDRAERTGVAAAVAIGVFIANLPIYGLQTIASLYVAKRLHLHPLALLLGSNLSMPLIGPLLIAAAIYLGFVVTKWRLPGRGDYDLSRVEVWEILGRSLVEWMVGGVLLGVLLGGMAFLLTIAFLSRIPMKDWCGEISDRPASE